MTMKVLKIYHEWKKKREARKEAERKAALKRFIEIGIPTMMTIIAVSEIIKFTLESINEFNDTP